MKHSSRRFLFAASAAVLMLAGVSSTFAGEAIPIAGQKFFPEGIAVDTRGGLYVGSLVDGKIIYLAPDSRVTRTFADEGKNGMVSVLGVFVNAAGNKVYACSSDPGFGKLTGTAKPALVAFNTKDGTVAGRYELPGGGICNDITELADGTILATDSVKARIYALAPGSDGLTVWAQDNRFKGKGFGLNGIVATPGAVFVVKYNSGSLFKISVGQNNVAGNITEIALDRPLKGPDGLEIMNSKNTELLVVEGGGLTRGAYGQLSKIVINGNKGAVKIIKDNMNVPTTVAIYKKTAYVVEGQLDHLFDKTAGAPDAFQIVKVTLK